MEKFLARLPRSRLEKTRSRESSQPAPSYERIEHLTKDLGKGEISETGPAGDGDSEGNEDEQKSNRSNNQNNGCLLFTRAKGRSTVWLNGKQNSGLVNFVPESRLPFEQISSIHRKPITKGG